MQRSKLPSQPEVVMSVPRSLYSPKKSTVPGGKISMYFIAEPTANQQKDVLQRQKCYRSCKLKYSCYQDLALNLKCLGKITEVSSHVIFIC